MNQVLWIASRPKITRAGTSTRAGSSRPVRHAIESSSRGWRGWRSRSVPGGDGGGTGGGAGGGVVRRRPEPPSSWAVPRGAGSAGAPDRRRVRVMPAAPPSPTKSKSLHAGSKLAAPASGPMSRRCRPTVKHVAVGRLEGELREAGGGEVGPDGGRGVGRATVPGPDDLRPLRHKPGIAWMVRVMSPGLMFPNTPQTSTRSAGTSPSYHRHSEASPSTIRTCSATPAAAARSRAKATRAGIELDEQRRHVAAPWMGRDDVDHVTALAGAHAHHPDGPGWVGGEGTQSRKSPHHGLDDPEPQRQRRRGVLVGLVPAHPVRVRRVRGGRRSRGPLGDRRRFWMVPGGHDDPS